MPPGRRKAGTNLALGYLEMEILPIVWRRRMVTVRDVFEELYEKRRLAYTTVMTVMKRLVEKDLLQVDASTIPFVYSAAVTSEALAARLVDEVIERLLDGEWAPLMLHCVENGKISSREQLKMRGMLSADRKADHDLPVGVKHTTERHTPALDP